MKVVLNKNYQGVSTCKNKETQNKKALAFCMLDHKLKALENSVFQLLEIERAYFEAEQNIQKKDKIEINSVNSIEKPKDFSDTKAFAKYLEYKIAKNLKYQSREDIEKIVENIAFKTNVDEDLVLEVLVRLTQFSSYADLEELSVELEKEKIEKTFSHNSHAKLDVNNILDYVGLYKGQLKNKPDDEKYRAVFIDENFIEQLKKEKENNTYFFDGLKREYKKGKFKFLALDGQNFKKNGKNYFYSMFAQNISLEDLAFEVIEKMKQQNLTLDEVLNSDIEQQLNEIFEDDIKVIYLKNNCACYDKIDKILKQVNPLMPDRSFIYAIIDRVVRNINNDIALSNQKEINKEKARKKSRKDLAQYLDSALVCFSAQTMNDALIQKYTQLKEFLKTINKSMDDVYYLIPQKNKSFDLITYQYLKANDIAFDKVINDYYLNKNLENKVVVLLDDFLGTGESFVKTSFDYADFVDKNPKTNLIFSPIISLDYGRSFVEKKIKNFGRCDKDFVLANQDLSYPMDKIVQLENKEIVDFSRLVDGFGYYNNATCISFPYGFPDNNSGFGILFAQYFLSNKRVANKIGCFEEGYSKQELYNIAPEILFNLIEMESKNYKD